MIMIMMVILCYVEPNKLFGCLGIEVVLNLHCRPLVRSHPVAWIVWGAIHTNDDWANFE